MKGKGRTVASANARDGASLDLVSFRDGSWAIRRDGKMHDTWEAEETGDCAQTFLRLTGAPAVILVRPAGGADFAPPHRLN